MAKPDMRSNKLTNTVGAMLIAFGLLLFFVQRLDGLDASNYWPFFIIVPGAGLMLAALFAEVGGKAGAAVGSAVTAVGLLLLYQNTFGHFESWAYGWSLVFPVGVGVGWMLFGSKNDDSGLVEQGWRYTLIGLGIFIVGFVFFELVIGISGFAVFGGAWNSTLWPILLIAAGVVLVYRSRSS